MVNFTMFSTGTYVRALVHTCMKKVLTVVLVSIVFVVGFHKPAIAVGKRSYFHSIEFSHSNITEFKKWTSLFTRVNDEMARAKNINCAKNISILCRYNEMAAFLDTLRGESHHEQLTAVNNYMNRKSYIPDAENWGVSDYWATPAEFLTRSGDCEDYAIAKFFALKYLGWNADSFRLVIVKDLMKGEGHAILVVFDEGVSWILDSQIKTVDKTTMIDVYEPVYSINETSWWNHKVVTIITD